MHVVLLPDWIINEKKCHGLDERRDMRCNSMPLKLSCDRGHVQMKWQPDERGQLNQHTLGCETRGQDLIQWTCPVKTVINCVFQQQKLCSEPNAYQK